MMSDTTTEAELANPAGKYLTFVVAGESFGIPILKVREIVRLTAIDMVPQMPDYISGVINLRGTIIPVVDLRVRLGFTERKDTKETCIVVVRVQSPEGKSAQTGLIVDGVEEVVNIAATDIEETPDLGGDFSSEYVVGMAKIKGTINTLLDIGRVLAGDTTQFGNHPIRPYP